MRLPALAKATTYIQSHYRQTHHILSIMVLLYQLLIARSYLQMLFALYFVAVDLLG